MVDDDSDDIGWEMDLTPAERSRLKAEYTPQQLMVVVAKVRDYFREYMGGGTYNGRPLELLVSTWGMYHRGTYKVCVAGLWYLMEYGELLPEAERERVSTPPIMLFLNALRFPSLAKDTIMELLRVDVSIYPPEDWDLIDNQYILTFLDWLILQGTSDQGAVAQGVADNDTN